MRGMYDNNPFTVLTAVAAPAILTNACSVLALGTANRIARVVDRSRVIMKAQAEADPKGKHYGAYALQIEKLRIRGALLLRALRLFYAALGMFAATALTAIVGSAMVAFDLNIAFHAAAVFGFIVGAFAVIGVVTGCALMVRETRLAVQSVAEEHDLHIVSSAPPVESPL
jgi:hypothetical protein